MAEGFASLLPQSLGWPRGARALLLQAALAGDLQQAEVALDQWLATHSLDGTEGRDHRLLALVAERFAITLKQRPEGPRLGGLQRQRWTRNHLMISAAKPALEEIARAALSVIVLAETAELCLDPSPRAGVQLQALDLTVPDDHLDAALVALGAAGWQPWSGESILCLRRRAPTLSAMQLQQGQLGCLRLHRWPLGDQPALRPLQAAMVSRATTCSLQGVPVLLPSPTERLAMALCRRSMEHPLDGLIQAAFLLTNPDLDGELLLTILKCNQALARAQILVSYLHRCLHQPIAPSLIAALMASGSGSGSRQRLLAIAGTGLPPLPRRLQFIARLLTPQLRRPIAPGPYSRPPACRGRVLPLIRGTAPTHPPADHQRLGCHACGSGPTVFLLELMTQPQSFGQDLVFELQSEDRYLIQLRARNLLPAAGVVRVQFRGRLRLPQGAHHLWLTSRPSRLLRPDAPAALRRRHGACDFQVLRFRWQPADA